MTRVARPRPLTPTVRRLLPEGVQMADETFRLKVMLEKGEVHIQPIVRGSEIWPRSVLG